MSLGLEKARAAANAARPIFPLNTAEVEAVRQLALQVHRNPLAPTADRDHARTILGLIATFDEQQRRIDALTEEVGNVW